MSLNERWYEVKAWTNTKARKLVGRFLAAQGKDGHNRLCRFNSWVCHWGPSGTFEYIGHIEIAAGGYLCIAGTKCGDPTEDYLEQMNEQLEWFHRTERALRKSGVLTGMVWENPRFSASTLCNCGQPQNPRLPEHEPLCPYRIEHDFQPSIEEYRQAIASVH